MNYYFYRVKRWTVIDGDTLDLDIDLGFDTTVSHRVRLMGVNTPESHSRASETEQVKGEAAKAYLKNLLVRAGRVGKAVVVETHKIVRRSGDVDERTGKYGRYMVTLWIEGKGGTMQNVNRALVVNGHANVYVGGKRPDEWEWLGEEQLG